MSLLIKGNFLISGKCTSPQMPDKKFVKALVIEHAVTFEQVAINSVSTDKGYFSIKNEKYLLAQGVNEIGIQRLGNIKKAHPKPLSKACQEKLANRRSGIEALIGHVKQKGQLGRSRMNTQKIEEKKISIWKKIGETLICIFIGAGVMYFYDLLKSFSFQKADQLFLIFGFGIVYAFFMNYNFDSFWKRKK